jgi:hypothetical protein
MIFSQPSHSPETPEQEPPTSTSPEPQPGPQDSDKTSSQHNILDNILISWQRLKDSTSDFLHSNSELYKNVMTTQENIEENEEALFVKTQGQNFMSKKISISVSVNHPNLPPDCFGGKSEDLYQDECQRGLLCRSEEEVKGGERLEGFARYSVTGNQNTF